jgi:cell division protein ZapE
VHRYAADAGFALTSGQQAALTALSRPESRGTYLFGEVGRGKTWLADAWVRALGERATVRRLHAVEFFQGLNRGPVGHVDETIDALVHGADLVLLDEFHLHDPGDAMLAQRVLNRLWPTGVRLLLTSNYAPEQLLSNPSFHHLFEPSITAIRERLDVVEVGGDLDLRTLSAGAATGFAAGTWTVGQVESDGKADATDAADPTNRADSAVEFTFAELCSSSRSASDLLDLARRHETWRLVDVPRLRDTDPQSRQRFADLIDVLVDLDRQLDVRSGHSREEVLDVADAEGEVPRDLARTRSRLGLLRVSGPRGRLCA